MRGWCYTSCIVRSWKFWMFWVGSGVVRYMERRVRRMRNSVYILRALWYSFWWYLHPTAETFKQLVYSYHDHARQAYFRETHTHTPTQTWLGYSHYSIVTHPPFFLSSRLLKKMSALYIQHISLRCCFIISIVTVLFTFRVFVMCHNSPEYIFSILVCL